MTKLMDKIRNAKLNTEKEYIVGIASNEPNRIAVVIMEKDNDSVLVEHVINSIHYRQINVALIYCIEDLGLKLLFSIDRDIDGLKIINYLVSHKHGKRIYIDCHETWKERITRWVKLKKPAPRRHGVQLTTIVRKTAYLTIAEFYDIPVSDNAIGAYICALYVKDRL